MKYVYWISGDTYQLLSSGSDNDSDEYVWGAADIKAKEMGLTSRDGYPVLTNKEPGRNRLGLSPRGIHVDKSALVETGEYLGTGFFGCPVSEPLVFVEGRGIGVGRFTSAVTDCLDDPGVYRATQEAICRAGRGCPVVRYNDELVCITNDQAYERHLQDVVLDVLYPYAPGIIESAAMALAGAINEQRQELQAVIRK